MNKTIADAKKLNKENGNFFFDAGAMRFFNSRIETDIIRGKFFVTSEQFIDREYKAPRKYTVREIDWSSGEVDTATGCTFQEFCDLDDARDWIKENN